MATAKWGTPATESSNLAGTLLNSLANGSATTRIAFDNSTNKNLYTKVTVVLGSITPGTGGSITLRSLHRRSTNDEDITTSLESYTMLLSTGASAKRVIIPMVRIYPFDMGFLVTNNAGVSLAATGNEFYCQDYNEDVT